MSTSEITELNTLIIGVYFNLHSLPTLRVDERFWNYLKKDLKTLCVPSTFEVVNHSFQSCLKKALCFSSNVKVDNRSFYYYVKPGPHCALHKISELKTLAFRATYKMKVLCFPATISIYKRSFQSYIKNWKKLCLPSTINIRPATLLRRDSNTDVFL